MPNHAQQAVASVPLRCSSCTAPLRKTDGTLPTFKVDDYYELVCECGSYPVVSGIPVLFSGLIPESTTNSTEILNRIRKKEFEAARVSLLQPLRINRVIPTPRWRRLIPPILMSKYERFVLRKASAQWQERFAELAADTTEGSVRRLLEHYFGRETTDDANASDYFSYRFGQPKHLVSLSIAEVQEADIAPALDLGCGSGLITRHLELRNPSHPVVGIDQNFFLLWLAKTRIARNSYFVLADAERGVPFPDKYFGTAILSNFIQFLRAKSVALSEVERACSDNALIALTSTRHSQFKAVTPNLAIPPASYGALLKRPHVIVNEESILNRYLKGLGPDLSSSDQEDILRTSPLIDIVASYDSSLLRKHGRFGDWPHAQGRLSINPLYKKGIKDDGVNLELTWPSEYFIEDNPGIENYLPNSVGISKAAMDALDGGEPNAELEALKAKVVAIDIPESY